MATRLYLGHWKGEPLRKPELFRSTATPTAASHPQYSGAVGPFRTKRGAEFMRDHGLNNPHLQTAGDADRIAAKYAKSDRDIDKQIHKAAMGIGRADSAEKARQRSGTTHVIMVVMRPRGRRVTL
jgi:hypothetical protein